jgi:hypothetical protein
MTLTPLTEAETNQFTLNLISLLSMGDAELAAFNIEDVLPPRIRSLPSYNFERGCWRRFARGFINGRRAWFAQQARV